MNRNRLWLSVAILIVLLLVWQSFFIVDEMEDAVVTFFGNPRRVYARQPGLKMKIPLLDKVYRFDNRLLVYEGLEAELLTFDKTNILITFFALWTSREPDLLFQLALMFAGALGIRALLPGRDEEG